VCVYVSVCECVCVCACVCVYVHVYADQVCTFVGAGVINTLDAGHKNQKGAVEALLYFESGTGMAAHREDAKTTGFLATATADATIAIWTLALGPRQFTQVHRFSAPYSQVRCCHTYVGIRARSLPAPSLVFVLCRHHATAVGL
jgi:hypothetical protein